MKTRGVSGEGGTGEEGDTRSQEASERVNVHRAGVVEMEGLKKLEEEMLPWSVEEQEQRRQEEQEQRRHEEQEQRP